MRKKGLFEELTLSKILALEVGRGGQAASQGVSGQVPAHSRPLETQGAGSQIPRTPGPTALPLLEALARAALATPEAPGRSSGGWQVHLLICCNEWLLLGVGVPNDRPVGAHFKAARWPRGTLVILAVCTALPWPVQPAPPPSPTRNLLGAYLSRVKMPPTDTGPTVTRSRWLWGGGTVGP